MAAMALGKEVSCLRREGPVLSHPAQQCCRVLPPDSQSWEPGSLVLQSPFQLRDLGTASLFPPLEMVPNKA